MAELRFNVFGKLIAVAPTATGWQAYLLDQDGKRSPMDIVVPAFIGTAIDQAITWDDYGPDPEEFDHVPGVDQMSTRIDERLKLAIVTAAVRMLSTSAAYRVKHEIHFHLISGTWLMRMCAKYGLSDSILIRIICKPLNGSSLSRPCAASRSHTSSG
jgi:hypothetical protein